MEEEIKEILEALKVDEEELELKSSVYPLELTPKEQKILLDYITNLQEENERYKIAYENVMIANKMLDEKYKDYKTRNEKAIERAIHIQKNYGYELSDLIFLLQGSDE